MNKRYFLVVVLLCLSLWQAAPSFAYDFDITRVSSVVSDCSSTIEFLLDFTFLATNTDITVPFVADVVMLALVDGTGQNIAGLFIFSGVGGGGTAVNQPLIPLPFLTAPVQRPFSIRVYDVTAMVSYEIAQLSPLRDVYTFDPADFGVCTHLPYGNPSDSAEVPQFTDGRINNWDMASPVVVFGQDYETGRGLVLYSPEGALLLEVRPEQIAAIEECPSENTLIAQAGSTAVYRLSSCEYQINAPSLDGTKTYVLIFNDLYANTGYRSYEE